MAIAEALRLSLQSTNGTVRLCAIGTAAAMLLVGSPQVSRYVTQGWASWKPVPPESTLEYQLGEWIAQHPPQGRVFASGGLRFRLNQWFDLPQIGGGFETGLRNRVPVDFAYSIRTGKTVLAGHETKDMLLELKALGAEYVVVHGAKSREYYRDFQKPERVAGSLPEIYRIEDDAIYALPRRGLAHLMRADELPQWKLMLLPDSLTPYVAAIEDASRPALNVEWKDPSSIDITGAVRPSDLVALQVNADPGWRATQDGRGIEVGQDRLGFILLHAAPAAETRIELRYRGTIEQRVMAALSTIAWITALLLLAVPRLTRGRARATSSRIP